MQVSVEKTSELSRKMTVSVSEDVVQEKMAERLKSLVREIKMDGFRPGKVPPHVVKKMYGDRIRSEVTGDLIQSTFYQALQDQDLKPAGYPHIHPSDETNGFQYTAVFEVYPEVSLQGIDQLEIERPVATVEETDVDAMVEKLRVQRKSWNAVERASETGDRITITFSGSAEGENFTNGKVEDYSVEIGSKQMIPGFEDNLTGLAVGANKTFTVTFPDDYGNAQLAGKPADFEVDVVKVEEPVLPEVDETFIKAYGIQEGTVEAFREDVRNTMERELEQALRGNLKNAVMDVLYEKNSGDRSERIDRRGSRKFDEAVQGKRPEEKSKAGRSAIAAGHVRRASQAPGGFGPHPGRSDQAKRNQGRQRQGAFRD